MFGYNDILKYKKSLSGTGLSIVIGAVYYEYIQIKKTLDSIVNTNVIDLNVKHPDYIYIKYHIYRESMLRQKTKELENKKWINVIVHPIGQWWKTIKHSVAWRLLEVAKNSDYHDRLKAVRQLSLIDHLKDWDYQHLAQMCDARTAISLARNFSDVRWFLPPRHIGAQREVRSLIYDLKQHLDKLKPCKCLNNFNSTVFNHFNILDKYIYKIDISQNNVIVSRTEYEFVRKSLEALFHLTRNQDACIVLIESGILITLMEFLKIFHHDHNIRFILAKILANLSVCQNYGNDFFVTGWVGVLARWTRNPDIRIQVTSAKALTNMDVDDKFPNEYQSRIYPLYPLHRIRKKPYLDIVFIHGLLGGVFVTWRQKDPKEPELGLYGKQLNRSKLEECNDIYLVGMSNENDSIGDLKKKRPNIAFNKTKLNILWTNEGKTITYTEDILVSTSPTKQETSLSDLATKELIETLRSANELKSDWEVVFPDCPIKASENAKGVFSISGDKWINDDRKDEYTFCWPMDWLPQEYPNIRIIGLHYETSISEWALNLLCPCDKIKSSLNDRAEEFLHQLSAANVGDKCPVLWVGHSMGGLVAKSIIIQSMESTNKKIRQIGENTRAIVFLGTPHKGSPVAKLKQHIQMIFSPSIEVKELRENSQLLLSLQEKFEKTMKLMKHPVEVVSIAEGCPTSITTFKFPLQFVNEESAKLDYGDFYVLSVDHLVLSKPMYRQSFLYQRLLRVIDDIFDTTKREIIEAEQTKNSERIMENLSRDHDNLHS